MTDSCQGCGQPKPIVCEDCGQSLLTPAEDAIRLGRISRGDLEEGQRLLRQMEQRAQQRALDALGPIEGIDPVAGDES